MDINYDASRPRIPDVSEYHRVVNWQAMIAALGMPVLGFKVGNGWLSDPMSDATFPAHFKGAEDNGLIPIGYWFGAQKVDDYLKAYSPKEGRIACLDFEFLNGHNITPKDAEDGAAFVTRLHSEWGRWPLFYGHSTWIEAGEPAGTAIENCLYWGPEYGPTLVVPRGVGLPVAHQYAASSRGPKPWHFAGVEDNPSIKGADGIGIGPDMNSMLAPFSAIQTIAGLGEGEDILMGLPQWAQDEVLTRSLEDGWERAGRKIKNGSSNATATLSNGKHLQVTATTPKTAWGADEGLYNAFRLGLSG